MLAGWRYFLLIKIQPVFLVNIVFIFISVNRFFFKLVSVFLSVLFYDNTSPSKPAAHAGTVNQRRISPV